jgi:hypothetical protein
MSNKDFPMRNNRVALYVGCAALVVGGLGLTVRSAFDTERSAAPPPPLYLQAATVPPPAETWPADKNTWPPPDAAGVEFHTEMIQLLTPRASVMAQEEESAPQPQRQRREMVREAPKDTVREVPVENPREATKESRQKSRAADSRKKKREQPQQVEESREDVEVIVYDRSGNRIRTQRVEREAGTARAEQRRGSSPRVEREVQRGEREVRRGEREVERAPQERAPQERSFAPFPFFGLFSPQ